jgi:hypothetical protein
MEGKNGFLPMTIAKRALGRMIAGDSVSFEEV